MENTNDIVRAVAQVVEEFVDIIGYAVTWKITEDTESCSVELEGENLGLLIGFHGKHIASVEYILNLMLARKLGPLYRKIYLDMNGYRKERLANIDVYVENAVKSIQKSRMPYNLYPMSRYERLYVHTLLKQYPDIISESKGEEPDRYIEIRFAS
jgi:spoIIIJ-associated protein